MPDAYLPRELPPGLEALTDLALDLRWTWSHGADELWRTLDPSFWERSENPWALLALVSRDRLQAMLSAPEWLDHLARLQRARQQLTTHTAVPSGMDSYGPDVISAFMPILNTYVSAIGLQSDELLALPAAARFLERAREGGAVGRELRAWETRLAASWTDIRFGNMNVEREAEEWRFTVQVYLGEVSGRDVRVQLYADAVRELPPVRVEMAEVGEIAGAANAALYQARTPANRPAQAFTPRVVPWHPCALVPLEATRIRWCR